MSVHTTLPVEIYLPILEYIDDLSSLAALCAVDRGESTFLTRFSSDPTPADRDDEHI